MGGIIGRRRRLCLRTQWRSHKRPEALHEALFQIVRGYRLIVRQQCSLHHLHQLYRVPHKHSDKALRFLPRPLRPWKQGIMVLIHPTASRRIIVAIDSHWASSPAELRLPRSLASRWALPPAEPCLLLSLAVLDHIKIRWGILKWPIRLLHSCEYPTFTRRRDGCVADATLSEWHTVLTPDGCIADRERG